MVIVYQKHKRHTQYMSEAAHSTPQSSQDATSAMFMCVYECNPLAHLRRSAFNNLDIQIIPFAPTRVKKERETYELNIMCISVNLHQLVATSHCYICQHRFRSQSHPVLFLSSLPLPLQCLTLLYLSDSPESSIKSVKKSTLNQTIHLLRMGKIVFHTEIPLNRSWQHLTSVWLWLLLLQAIQWMDAEDFKSDTPSSCCLLMCESQSLRPPLVTHSSTYAAMLCVST